MATTRISTAYSRVRIGLGRADITPPVGIYHRLWGAARHDRATGVHRPVTCEVMVFGALEDAPSAPPRHIRAVLDLAGLVQEQHETLVNILSEKSGVAPDQIVI